MGKEYITEVAWSKIFVFLKDLKTAYTRNEKRCKFFLEAVYWIMRTGAQWRELPAYYGKWNSVFKRFNAWSKKGIWDGLLTFCIEDPDFEYVMIDSTIVRAHACSAGYGEQEKEGLGRSKGGFSSKIHVLGDALGNLLKIIITPGQRHDITQAETLLHGIKKSFVLGDKGYHSKNLRETLSQQNCTPVIPPRSNSKSSVEYDKHVYEERHRIENFFSKIKHFRRIFSRFDKSIRNYASFISFAGAILWLR